MLRGQGRVQVSAHGLDWRLVGSECSLGSSLVEG